MTVSPTDRCRVVLRLLGLATFIILHTCAASAQTALVTFSQSGDFAGGGNNKSLTPTNAIFSASSSFNNNGVTILVQENGASSPNYRLEFVANDQPLHVGTYSYAIGSAHRFAAQLHVEAPNYCSESAGRFVVRELVKSGNSILRFAADFEQHCYDNAPALIGAIRYQSTIATANPFEGNFPVIRLDVTTPVHGTVSGAGLTCGSGGSTCSLSPPFAMTVLLTATPDAGYIFAGWSGGGCSGGATTAVTVHMLKQCAASFTPIVPAAAQTVFAVGSASTDVIGKGRNFVVSTGSYWQFTQYTAIPNHTVLLEIDSLLGTKESSWNFEFAAPHGELLTPGYYPNTSGRTFVTLSQPGMDLYSDSAGCMNDYGSFWVHEVTFNPDGSIASLALDFEYECESPTTPPPLVGSIRYNSAVPVSGFMTVSPVGSGRVTSTPTSLYCGLGGSACTSPFILGSLLTLNADSGPGWSASWSGDATCGSAPFVVGIRMNCLATFTTCAINVSPPAGSAPLMGTTNTFTVTGPVNCGWAATAAAPWLSVSGGSGVGPGIFYVTSAANGSPGNRAAAVVLNGTTPLTIYQVGRPVAAYDRARWNTDGDPKTDVAVWRASTGMWYSLNSSSLALRAIQWGSSALHDVLVPGDYDGDGLSDIAVWRPADGTWYILRSSVGYASPVSLQWGSGTLDDIPVPGDYDGDGRVDPAVWRPSTGTWYIRTSSSYYTAILAVPLGDSSQGDRPLVGDYDGDGRADMAVWRPATGAWTILTSHTNYNAALKLEVQWGSDTVGDQPVIGDFDGDGATDIAVWRHTDGTWYILPSSANFSPAVYVAMQWGSSAAGDIPVRGDFDGDGRSDLAVWRAPTGMWYIRRSSTNFTDYLSIQWGSSTLGDIPVTK